MQYYLLDNSSYNPNFSENRRYSIIRNRKEKQIEVVTKFHSDHTYYIDVDLAMKHYPYAYPIFENGNVDIHNTFMTSSDQIKGFRLWNEYFDKDKIDWEILDSYRIKQIKNHFFLFSDKVQEIIKNPAIKLFDSFEINPVEIQLLKSKLKYFLLDFNNDMNDAVKNSTVRVYNNKTKDELDFNLKTDSGSLEYFDLIRLQSDIIFEKTFPSYSDIISLNLHPGIYVSEKLKELFIDNGITGLKFIYKPNIKIQFAKSN